MSDLLVVSHLLKSPVASCEGNLGTEVLGLQSCEEAGRGTYGRANRQRTGTEPSLGMVLLL